MFQTNLGRGRVAEKPSGAASVPGRGGWEGGDAAAAAETGQVSCLDWNLVLMRSRGCSPSLC